MFRFRDTVYITDLHRRDDAGKEQIRKTGGC
jgi:hypothetical protein